MFYQTILVAAALSCTLPCVPTIRQTSATNIDQIKDLLCVLLLSGLEKEDLNPQTLMKLQRHNVNIDQLDNGNTRSECLRTKGMDYQTSINTTPPLFYTNLSDADDTTPGDATEQAKSFKISALKNLLSNYERLKRLQPQITEPTVKDTVSVEEIPTKISYGIPNEITPSKLQSIIKFWNTLQTKPSKLGDYRRVVPINDDQNPVIAQKQEEHDTLTSNNAMELFTKIINAEKPPQSGVTNKPVRSAANSKNITEIINNLLSRSILRQNAPNTIYAISSNHTNSVSVTTKILENKPKIDKEDTVKGILFNEEKNVNDCKLNHPHFQSHAAEPPSKEVQNRLNVNSNYTGDLKIQPNIIKEIVNEVKQIILKDLKEEITDNRPTTTELTTITTSVVATVMTENTTKVPEVKNKQSLSSEVDIVIDKFLKLFEQLKQQKQETNEKEKSMLTKQSSSKLMNMNSFSMKPEPNMSLQFQQPQIYPMQNSLHMHPNPVIGYTRVIQTIQTNAYPIPPIPVAINIKGQPEAVKKLIEHQNIILSTKEPFEKEYDHQRQRNERLSKYRINKNLHSSSREKFEDESRYKKNWFRSRDYYQSQREYDRYSDSRQRHEPRSKYSQRMSNYEDKGRSDDAKFRSDDSRPYQPRIREEAQDFASSKTYGTRYPSHKTSLDLQDTNRGMMHSKQEGSDSSDKIKDSLESRVRTAKRPQKSLHRRKKAGYRFDDTHFKNFLKTQQKVNDMLETILGGTKPKKSNVDHIEVL